MTVTEAKVILENFLAAKDTTFEDDDGNLVSGWYYALGERVTEMSAESGRGTMAIDEGSIAFVAYLLPPDISIVDVPDMTEEEQDEYGSLWCVSPEGEIYTPEA